jgi:hypothetical protein
MKKWMIYVVSINKNHSKVEHEKFEKKDSPPLIHFFVFHTSLVISQPSLYNFIANYDTCSKPLPKALNNPKLTMHLKQEESDIQYLQKQILVE